MIHLILLLALGIGVTCMVMFINWIVKKVIK